MTAKRAALTYNKRRPIDPNRVWGGVDADVPTAGFYRIQLRRDGVPCAVRIWEGAPIDPATGEELTETRGARWQATLNGAPVEMERVWPGCARRPISLQEHDRLAARALTQDPEDPFFDARRPVDLRTARLPF